MNRRTAEVIVVAAVAVLVVSAAASTLDSTASGSGAIGLGGTNESGTSLLPDISTELPDGGGGSLSLPRGPLVALLALGLLAAFWYLVRNPEKSLGLILTAALIFAVLLVLMAVLPELLGDTPGQSSGGLMGGGTGIGSGGYEGTDGARLPLESIQLLGVVVLGAVLVAVALGVSRDPVRRSANGDPVERADGAQVEGIGQVAGETADRIEANAAVDNEVYRAWVEMTGLLSAPDPETGTPGEFAAAATEAGMDPDDVAELTALFELIRYGPEEPTTDREERAIAALRRIEAAYAPEDE